MPVHNEITISVVCPRGNAFPLVLRNLGWHAEKGGYVTQFEFQGDVYNNLFQTEKHVEQHCATPDLRSAGDVNFLFEELGLILGDGDDS